MESRLVANQEAEALVTQLLSSSTYDEFDELFRQHADVFFQYRNADQLNILHRAIYEKKTVLYKYLFEKQKRFHVLLNEKNLEGRTPLEFAVDFSEYPVLLYLIKRNFDFPISLHSKLLQCLVDQPVLDLTIIEQLYQNDAFQPLFTQADSKTLNCPINSLLMRLDRAYASLEGNAILQFLINNRINYTNNQGYNFLHYVGRHGDITKIRELSKSEFKSQLNQKNNFGSTPISLLINWSRAHDKKVDELNNFLHYLYLSDVQELEVLIASTQKAQDKVSYMLSEVVKRHLKDLKAIPSSFSADETKKFNASDYERLAPMVHAMKQCIKDPLNPANADLISQVLADKEFCKLKNEKNRIWLKRIFLNFVAFSGAFAALTAAHLTLPLLLAAIPTTLVAGHYLNKMIASLDNTRLKEIGPKIAAFYDLKVRSPEPLRAFSLFKEEFIQKVRTMIERRTPRV